MVVGSGSPTNASRTSSGSDVSLAGFLRSFVVVVDFLRLRVAAKASAISTPASASSWSAMSSVDPFRFLKLSVSSGSAYCADRSPLGVDTHACLRICSLDL